MKLILCNIMVTFHVMVFYFLGIDTPGLRRKSSLTEADAEEIGEKTSLPGDRLSLGSDVKSFGGSQGSLNSSASTVAPDNPKQFESLKEMKGLMEQGIEK